MPVQGTTLVRAFATLTADADADITDGETVVIAGLTYTFEAGTLDGIDDVPHVTGFAANMAALVKAINVTGTVGTDYYTGSVKNLYCHAVLTSSGVVTIYSRNAGVVGNLLTITIGTSAIVLSDDSSGKLDTGAGHLDLAINKLQSDAQLNSDTLAFLAAMEIDPDL